MVLGLALDRDKIFAVRTLGVSAFVVCFSRHSFPSEIEACDDVKRLAILTCAIPWRKNRMGWEVGK